MENITVFYIKYAFIEKNKRQLVWYEDGYYETIEEANEVLICYKKQGFKAKVMDRSIPKNTFTSYHDCRA